MRDTSYMATEKWLICTQKAMRAAKRGNWKIAERYFRKAVAFSIGLDLTTHLYAIIYQAIALRQLKRTVEAQHLAGTVRRLTLEKINRHDFDFQLLLDLSDLLKDEQPDTRSCLLAPHTLHEIASR